MFLHLHELKLHRGSPAKDADHDAQFSLVGLDILDNTGEIEERPIDNPHSLTNLKQNNENGNIRYVKVQPGDEASLEYLLTTPDDNPLYVFLLTQDDSKSEVFLNGQSLGYFGENSENNQVISLGRFKAGQEISIKLALKRDSLSLLQGEQFYDLNMDQFTQDQKQLDSNPLKITSYTDTSLVGEINNPDDQVLLFTSIPFDQGWSVRMDGKETPTVKLLDTFTGVNVPPGHHQINFAYNLPGLWPGMIISILSLMISITFMGGIRLIIKNEK